MAATLAPCPPCRRAIPSRSFDAATAVRRAEGGGIVADLDPGWDVGGGILNGGYLLAVIGRAAVLDSPHPAPGGGVGELPARHGPRAGDPDRHARAGRADARAQLRRPRRRRRPDPLGAGDDGDARRRRPPVYSGPMPDVPPVEECLSAQAGDDLGGHPVPEVGLRRRVETRLDPATAGLGGGAAVG